MPTIDLGYVIGPAGPQGVPGADGGQGIQGPAGPNQVTGSTSTTLNGILQGNGSAVSALQSDSAPTADSNNAIRSGAVHTALTKKVGRNLLRNWYFAGGGSQAGGIRFPINTRGLTTYSSNGFCIDSWQFNAQSYGTLKLNNSYITLNKNAAESGVYLYQDLDENLNGQVVTISLITTIGFYTKTSGILSASNLNTWQLSMTDEFGWVGLRCMQGTTSVYWQLRLTTDAVNLIAIKLETGPVQSLGYYAGGYWYVTELPELSAETFRSQTARIDSLDQYGFHFPAFANMIAPVESGLTASRQYTTGKLFVWNGWLYRATTTISSGVAFNPGANCETTTIAAQLNL